jgi:hypothetical protein
VSDSSVIPLINQLQFVFLIVNIYFAIAPLSSVS